MEEIAQVFVNYKNFKVLQLEMAMRRHTILIFQAFLL